MKLPIKKDNRMNQLPFNYHHFVQLGCVQSFQEIWFISEEYWFEIYFQVH